jgi:hypothetical protein
MGGSRAQKVIESENQTPVPEKDEPQKEKRHPKAALFDLTEKSLQRRFNLKAPSLEEGLRDIL